MRARGYTLLEVLGVVTLIGVLAAIALPSYASYRNNVRNKQAAADITAMSIAITSYYQDWQVYPPNLAAVGQDGMTDPWGRPYAYYNVAANGKGGARKDHALNPINTDYDLYSVGADGSSHSQITQKSSLDDIIRASNGSFVGVAANF